MLAGQRGPVFARKEINLSAAQEYLRRFSDGVDLSAVPPLHFASSSVVLSAAWERHPQALAILGADLWRHPSGRPILPSNNSTRGAFIVKGEEGEIANVIARAPDQTRPLGLKRSCNKIIAGTVFEGVNRPLNA
eukprot:2133330-Pyramimonas_sp.AAC.1